MSVQHESVGTGKTAERTEVAPELEYRAVSQDSLTMFLAAIGGAILGMLLTLLVLALINGGTLSYAGDRIKQLESHLQQVDENVGAVSANINIVSEQAAAIQQQLGAVESALRNEIETQGGDLAALNESVTTLNHTRQQFDIFVGALTGALAEMGAIEAPLTESPIPAGTALTETPALTVTAPFTAAEAITQSAALTTTTDVTASEALTANTSPSTSATLTETAVITTELAPTQTTAMTAATALTETVTVTDSAPVTASTPVTP